MTLRWILFALLALFFLGNATANASMYYRFFVYGKRGSAIPLLGAVAGTVGLLIVPVEGMRSWWWLPWVMDPGGLFWCGMTVYWSLRKSTARRG